MGDERERLRATFDSAAVLYQRARPAYPVELYEALIRSAGIRPGDHLLEIGCATGTATRPFAERGFHVTAIELGPALARAARQNLGDLEGVVVLEGAFETWDPPLGARFDLVFAATAWHWLDPTTRYTRAWSLLRPGGHLAFWGATHVFPDGGDPFFREIQEAYEAIGEGLPPGAAWPRPGELPDAGAEIEASGCFDMRLVEHFDWEIVYDADGYVELLDTFSGHIAMESWQREELYGEVRRRLALRPDGTLRRHWGTVLHVARRRENRTAANDTGNLGSRDG